MIYIRDLFGRAGWRIVASFPAIFGVVLLTFLLMRVLPGDPAVFFASGPNAGAAEIEAIRERMGLDRPILEQFIRYISEISTGNLGNSIMTGMPVTEDLLNRLPASLELTIFALVIALSLALPLGIFAALRPNSPLDHLVRLICTLGTCMPTFVSGLLLIYIFYYILGFAPEPTGRIDIFVPAPPAVTNFLLVDSMIAGDMEAWSAALAQVILPAVTMALFVLAPLARMTRASMLTVLNSDFIRTAQALGLSRFRIIVIYGLRNALVPVLTVIGIVFSTMLGANVLVEKVFSWPGVASYALDALLASDYAPVQGFVLLMAAIFVFVNLVIDILYGIIDPRVTAA